MDLSAWDFLEAPFKRIHDELAELQTQYYRMEHITRGVNMALDNCGPGNFLRELAKRADRKELEQLKTEKAQLTAHVAAMTQDLNHKSEEIRKCHAKQAVVFSQIRVLVGHPGEVVNKAHLYDRMMDSSYPSFARKTLALLVKYSRMMKDLLAEIQKVDMPSGTPMRVLYLGPPGSPIETLYEVVGEVALLSISLVEAGPIHLGGASQPTSSGRAPNREGSGAPEKTRSSQIRRKNIGSVRDRTRTPIRRRTPKRESIPDRGKAPMAQASPASPPDCQMVEPFAPPPSRAASTKDP